MNIKNEHQEMQATLMNINDRVRKVEKLRKDDPLVFFELILKDAFAKEFNEVGIYWQHFIKTDDEHRYSIEEHQKLKPLTPAVCSLENAQKQAAIFTNRVERRLGFAQLSAQLKQHFGIESVEKVCIARNALPKYEDFAIFENNIIPINTSNFFLAIINSAGKWNFSVKADAFSVNLKSEEFVFAPKEVITDNTELALKLLSTRTKWWLFSKIDGEKIIAERMMMAAELEKINSANMNILATKKPIPVKSITLSCQEEKALYPEG